jgi:hypothetical protein
VKRALLAILVLALCTAACGSSGGPTASATAAQGYGSTVVHRLSATGPWKISEFRAVRVGMTRTAVGQTMRTPAVAASVAIHVDGRLVHATCSIYGSTGPAAIVCFTGGRVRAKARGMTGIAAFRALRRELG